MTDDQNNNTQLVSFAAQIGLLVPSFGDTASPPHFSCWLDSLSLVLPSFLPRPVAATTTSVFLLPRVSTLEFVRDVCSDKKWISADCEKCLETSASIGKCVRRRSVDIGTMAEREDNVYKAKLAEQAERYDGKD